MKCRGAAGCCLVIFGFSCGSAGRPIGPLNSADGGARDTGGTPDAGATLDAGGTPDAGATLDAGGTPDTGATLDAGGTPDTEGTLDAGAYSLPLHFLVTHASKVDLLLVVDDSPGAVGNQKRLQAALPPFLQLLTDLPGQPDLHIAVASSSLGAGAYADVPGCTPNSPGNRSGQFSHPAACTGLHAGQSFVSSSQTQKNFDGNLADVVSCLVDLGDKGCPFVSPFGAAMLALQRSLILDDVNTGFRRQDAHLVVIISSGQDDCSVPPESKLFDPAQRSLNDRYGGLRTYRCNEFGHICAGVPPPHTITGSQSLLGCTSAEDGELMSVASFVEFLGMLTRDKSHLFLGAFAGPALPYTVTAQSVTLPSGAIESQPQIQHSCGPSADVYGDPGIRIKAAADAVGPGGFVGSICSDLDAPLGKLVQQLGPVLPVSCLDPTTALTAGGTAYDCQVVQELSVGGTITSTPIFYCNSTMIQSPCWRVIEESLCGFGHQFTVCRNPGCDAAPASNEIGYSVSCRHRQ